MERRRLGPDGPVVSAVGVGAMSFIDFYGACSEEAAHAVLRAALDLGIDHLDTSNVYGMGRSEEIVGSFLAKQGRAGRDLFRIATKGGIARDPHTGKRGFDNSKAHLQAELEKSLKRLRVDHVDLYYVHRRDPQVPIEEVTTTLAGFVRDGKIRRFGFSEIAPSSLRRAAAVHPVAAVQSEYSLWTRLPELGLVQACEALGTTLVAFSPVGRGMLTDRPPSVETITRSDFLRGNPRFVEPNFTANLQLADGLRNFALARGTHAATIAIAWLLHKSPAVVAIPGTRSVAHLKELAAGGSYLLSEGDVQRLEELLPVGWAHGDRYSQAQWIGPEHYC